MIRLTSLLGMAAAIAIAVGTVEAGERPTLAAPFSDKPVLAAAELATMTGRQAVALPDANTLNLGVVAQTSSLEDSAALVAQQVNQALITQVGTSVATSVAQDIAAVAGNVAVGVIVTDVGNVNVPSVPEL